MISDKPPETQKLTFNIPKYEITAFTEYTGMIEQFVANLEYNDVKSSITYDLPVTDGEYAAKVIEYLPISLYKA